MSHARRQAEPPLTAEQLAAGLRHLSQRIHVPSTVTAALDDPFLNPLLRGTARMLARQAKRRSVGPFDARRAAANDLKDD